MSVALAELCDTPGETVDAVIAAYKAKRGAKLCATDHKAITRFRVECNEASRNVISGQEATADRLEGKVTQPTTQTVLTLTAQELAQLTEEQLADLANGRAPR